MDDMIKGKSLKSVNLKVDSNVSQRVIGWRLSDKYFIKISKEKFKYNKARTEYCKWNL